jgi:superfamily II DNA or RNA helicase
MRLDTGGGKCLGRGTPVLMFDGSIRSVETIQAGEHLMGPDSQPRNVKSVCSGREMLYRVTPVKGSPYIVNESHILSLQTTGQRWGQVGGKIVNISVRDYLKQNKAWKHVHKGWRSGVDFPAQSLPETLPPYLLGVWLGDGHSDVPAVTTMDRQILESLIEYSEKFGLSITARKAGGRSFSFGMAGKSGKRNPFTEGLRSFNLLKNKHIPLLYKTSSRKDRLEVLAGLMDTDGSYTGKGYDFISVRRELSEDVAYVARSLGMAAYVHRSMKSCNGAEPEEYWRVNISGDVDEIPCRIPHKKARPRLQKKSVLRTGITVEPIGEGEYFGFEIDGDHLFMLGDFTVTHNTHIFSEMINEHIGYSCLIAHRDSIVLQISLSLAKLGVRHNLMADRKLCEKAADLHVKICGANFYDPSARCTVASVDTLIRRKNLEGWAAQITLWIVDEGHHVVEDNKWHRAIGLFTNKQCHGLLPTATPKRADGLGLGKPELGGDGVADVMVEGPPMRWLIEQGYLCDYDVISADSHLTELLGEVGKSGDWSTAQRKAAAEQSPIVGDVVNTYRLLNAGYYRGHEARAARTAVVFAPDVDTATKMLTRYRQEGIRAELVTADTDLTVRMRIFEGLEKNTIDVVIAVDIISEGTDLPALLVGILARSTASLGLYMQQLGRILRPIYVPGFDLNTQAGRLASIAASPKPRAIIIDHVGNFARHGPPDRPRLWSLVSTSRKNAGGDAIPQRVCLNPMCSHPYYRYLTVCPHCNTPAPPPAERSSPSMVEGDMVMLDEAVLNALRGELTEALMSVSDYRAMLAAKGTPQAWIYSHAKQWAGMLETRQTVQQAMGNWGGRCHAQGLDDRQMQRLFWHKFGIDVYTAQTLTGDKAEALLSKLVLDQGAI